VKFDVGQHIIADLRRRQPGRIQAEILNCLANRDATGIAPVEKILVVISHQGATADKRRPETNSFLFRERDNFYSERKALAIELFERVRAAGLLRDDVTYLDVEFLLEFLAAVKLGNASRTAELRQRHLAVVIDGLRAPGRTPLPGQPPTWEEQTQRWLTH